MPNVAFSTKSSFCPNCRNGPLCDSSDLSISKHTPNTYLLEWLSNLGEKSGERSVKIWTTNFYNSFSKNILLHMNGQLSKICSVHTYVIPRTVYFGWIFMCMLYKWIEAHTPRSNTNPLFLTPKYLVSQ